MEPPKSSPPAGGAIIIGAGPAGLTAAYELLTRTNIQPIILEADNQVGGLAKTVWHNGNGMDIGPHRFFSRSKRVNKWWAEMLPIQGGSIVSSQSPHDDRKEIELKYHGRTQSHVLKDGPDPAGTDRVMLVRSRFTRIYFRRKFFAYPLALNFRTLSKLGIARSATIVLSYLKAKLFPKKPEATLQEFFINRFGAVLYETFFRDYTEKVWGVPCGQLSADWGAQRVKGVSIYKVLVQALKSKLGRDEGAEPSLAEYFFYPKLGTGQMWEEAAKRIRQKGGQVHLLKCVIGVEWHHGKVLSVTTRDLQTGEEQKWSADYFFSTMAIKDLIAAMGSRVPEQARQVASELPYRDFISLGLLVTKLLIKHVADNWIYIQEPDVKLGRLVVYNNFSPWMVRDADTVWLGLDYFVNEGDEIWNMRDREFVEFASRELEKIGIIDSADILDSTVVRMKKSYPSYFGSYDRFPMVQEFLDSITNLYPLGRNGMHKYNNQDHSMLTAMVAVDNIVCGRTDKGNIWDVNTEMEHHEGGSR
jgi:protoporphyrinogen oxidase